MSAAIFKMQMLPMRNILWSRMLHKHTFEAGMRGWHYSLGKMPDSVPKTEAYNTVSALISQE